jgi:hypothetical protein
LSSDGITVGQLIVSPFALGRLIGAHGIVHPNQAMPTGGQAADGNCTCFNGSGRLIPNNRAILRAGRRRRPGHARRPDAACRHKVLRGLHLVAYHGSAFGIMHVGGGTPSGWPIPTEPGTPTRGWGG